MKGIDHLVDSDVLVVGAGLAGCQAAIEASCLLGHQRKVVIVDKGKMGKSGQSVFAAGIFTVFDPEEDDLHVWMEEIIQSGEYLNDQEWCKKLFEETMPVVRDMEKWAGDFGQIIFEKDAQGKFLRRRSRGHVNTKHCVVNSLPMMLVHRRQMLKQQVQIVEKVMVTDLLNVDGLPVGALGLDYVNGETYLFRAKAIILAASGSGFKSVFMGHKNLTGDLQAAAFEAGAVMRNMENCVSNTCAKNFDIHGLNLYVSVGGRFLNGKGEDFMWKYHPTLGSRANLQHLVMSFCREVQEGRGPIYLDMSSASPVGQELCRKILPESFRLWDSANINLFKQPVEWIPAFLGTLAAAGGIDINLRCETNMANLYAAGDITCMPPHGTYSFGGINLSFCAVSGREAGRNAIAAARKASGSAMRETTIARLAEETMKVTLAPVTRRPVAEMSLRRAVELIQGALIPADVAFYKSGASLKRSLAEIDRIEQDIIPRLSASTPHELRNAIEIRSMAAVARLIVAASLAREESRGFHFREEYPQTDNQNWLKWVMVQKDTAGALRLSTRPVPTPYVQPAKAWEEPPGTVKGTGGDNSGDRKN